MQILAIVVYLSRRRLSVIRMHRDKTAAARLTRFSLWSSQMSQLCVISLTATCERSRLELKRVVFDFLRGTISRKRSKIEL